MERKGSGKRKKGMELKWPHC